MSGVDIINAANSRFFNGSNGQPTWVYKLGGNGTVVLEQNGITGPSIDCSNLVYQSLLAAGYNVAQLDTAGFTNIVNGASSRDYSKIEVGKPGDLILFDGDTNGHIGIITEIHQNSNGYYFGTYEGAQSANSGLRKVVKFNTDPNNTDPATKTWGSDFPFLGFIHANESRIDDTGIAAAKLMDINNKVNVAAGREVFSSTEVSIADNQGGFETYHVMSQNEVNQIINDYSLPSYNTLLLLSQNLPWQNLMVPGANGGDMYLVRDGSKLYFTAEDNDFQYSLGFKYPKYNPEDDNPSQSPEIVGNIGIIVFEPATYETTVRAAVAAFPAAAKNIIVDNPDGTTAQYTGIQGLQQIATYNHMTLAQLTHLAGNEHIANQIIEGPGGIDYFLAKSNDIVYTSPVDNDGEVASYNFLHNGSLYYDPEADNPYQPCMDTSLINNTHLNFVSSISPDSNNAADTTDAWQTGSAMGGGDYTANMPIDVINGDGFTNTEISKIVTDNYKPGATELFANTISNSINIKNDINTQIYTCS